MFKGSSIPEYQMLEANNRAKGCCLSAWWLLLLLLGGFLEVFGWQLLETGCWSFGLL